MNNPGHSGENHHRQGQAPTGLPPHLQHHLQQQQRAAQDPQLAFLLANAAAARGQQPGGGGVIPGHLGAGNNNHIGGFGGPSPYGNGGERHGTAGGLPQSAAAAQLFEEQILQRASALRAEAIMQQQQNQQQNQQQLQIQAALKAIQQQQRQQQQLSSLGAPAPSSEEAALWAQATALREMQLATASPAPTSALDRIREQLMAAELHRRQQQQSEQRNALALEQEHERIRQAQRLAAMGPPTASGPADDAKALLEKLSAGAAAQTSNSTSATPPTKDAPETAKPKTADPAPSKPKTPKRGTPAKEGRTATPLKPNPKTTTPASEAPKKSAGAGAAAAAAVRCKTREELQKDPGTVIVPCRARGMPMDHNFISAYFVIAEDAKHGENLVCSYYACRNGGIKFRYCAYCMAPVAKRNFSRRHDHGMSKKKGVAVSIPDDDEDDEDDDTVAESELTLSDKGSLSGFVSTSKKKELSASENDTKRSPLEDVQLEETVGAQDVGSKRQAMWNDLLTKRPPAKDPKALSKWLNEVLAVSDLGFPLGKVGDDTVDGASLGKVLSNELSKLTQPTGTASPDDDATDSNLDTTSSSSTTVESLKETTNSNHDVGAVVGNNKQESATPVKDNTVAKTETAKFQAKSLQKKLDKKRKKSDDDDDSDSDEGFAGNFADWRDRKKGKSLKKGSSSLRK